VVGVLAYLVLATFPGEFRAITPGLDPSWTYGINVLPHTDFRFGQDVVFTYGPLGYLLVPHHIGSNLAQAAVFWVATQAAMVALAVYHFRRNRRVAAVVLFAVTYLAAMAFGLILDNRLTLLVALLLTVPPEDRRVWPFSTAAAAALAAMLLFAKFNIGLGALAMVVLASGAWLLARRARLRHVALWVGVPLAVVTLLGAMVLLGGTGNFLLWLSLGAEIVRGFPSAMGFGEPPLLPILALCGVAAAAAAMAVLARRERGMLPMLLPLAVVVFLAFRHSFVRHHGRFLSAALLGAIAVVMLTAGSRRRLVAGGVAAILVLPPAIAMSAQEPCGCPINARALGPSGWSRVSAMLRWGETTRGLDRASELALRADTLPAEWIEEIEGARAAVDALPWEIAVTRANGLPWIPNPVLQSYHAYTTVLDRRVAEHFAGDRAPPFLIVQYLDIDGRHPMLASPAMWRSIVSGYEVARHDTLRGLVLLRRRARPVPLTLSAAGSVEATSGRWIEVPQTEGLFFGRIELDPSLVARLAAAFWRIEAVYVDLDYGDGGYVRVRVLPGTFPDGLLLNRPPLTEERFVGFLSGRLPRQVLRFRIAGPGLGSYGSEMRVTWWNAPWEPAERR
jgi:hypothetical protein